MTLAIAFLTGQSDPGRCALSPEQWAFGQALVAQSSGTELVSVNFPYCATTAPHRPVPLWRASVANAWQYWRARHSAFIGTYRSCVMNGLDRYPRLLLLAGSCGLELLNGLQLPSDYRQKIVVLAYGPVARSRGPWASSLVQGRRDRLSRAFFPRVDSVIEAGHMDYLQSPEFFSIALATIAQLQGAGVHAPAALGDAV
jgi:hypothetical protein